MGGERGEDEGAEQLYPSAGTSSKALSDKGVGMKTTRWSQMVGRALVVCVLCDIDH